MKKIILLFFLTMLCVQAVEAQTYDTLPLSITGTYNLTNNKIWVLKGFTRVQNGGVLNIPAGTLIYGQNLDTSRIGTLIIEMGGKIFAQGTASQPIIFTSNKPPGQRLKGDWGGLVICGRARANAVNGIDTTQIIEGSIGSYYGGTNDADNSGVLRYVRIEFAGANLTSQSGNELNSLTMGGVGSGTTIEYVMVSYGFDDGFEWFGGTVNCKYLISYATTDDDMDVDYGYRGKLQFGFVVRTHSAHDQSGSHGIESDNNPNTPNNFNTPRTKPIFSNFTFIGPKQDTNTSVHPDFKRGYHLRRNSLTSVYNSIMMGWPDAILFDGTGVTCAAQNDTMQHRYNIFAGNPGGFKSTNAGCGFVPAPWINNAPFSNRVFSTNSQVMLVNAFGDSSLIDPAPLAGSPALTGANFSNPNLSGFEITSFVGAFAQTSGDNHQWMSGWASFTPQSNQYVIGIQQISSEVPAGFTLGQNYPNPFNPVTKIKFSLPQSGFVTLKVYNLLGEETATLVNQQLGIGTYKADFNAANLSSGVYFYRLNVKNSQGNEWTEFKKMMLVK